MIQINPNKWKTPVLIGVATEGWIRYEWANARYSQIIPINWAAAGFDINYAALGFSIDDAYNLMVKHAINIEVEWLLIIEDDVMIPPDAFIRLNKYMQKGDIPVVSGLYFSKGNPSEPLVFRGRGNGCFYKWKLGDKIWCDGLPMGCLLIHMSVLRKVWNEAKTYRASNGEETNQVFITPRKIDFTMTPFHFNVQLGTQDLFFFDKLLADKKRILKESGWQKIARKKYPFLCDTNVFCKHIDRSSGKTYPITGGN
jgi:hypothetical protein